jgi:hypothetical protein
LIPIGQNYQNPKRPGDSAALYFGKPISIQHFKNQENFALRIKQKVFDDLTTLTTHIKVENYDAVLAKLNQSNVDYTRPEIVNERIAKNTFENEGKDLGNKGGAMPHFLFRLINLPFIFLWRGLVKPKVPEPEFEATFRFGFVILVYPVAYLLGLVLLNSIYDIKTACLILIGHAALNLVLVKLGVTSSNQRK